MIARTWRGWAPAATADEYQRHYESEVAEHLRQISGFSGARLLRRHDGDNVMFTSIVYFTSRHAVNDSAGPPPEHTVGYDAARRALTRWDDRVTHHHVAIDIGP